MKNLHRRIEVLQAVRDEKCLDCWERLISVVTDLLLALERHGIQQDTARRLIFYPGDASDDERALVEAARPAVQEEIISMDAQQMRWHGLRPCCEGWFTRHTGGAPNEY